MVWTADCSNKFFWFFQKNVIKKSVQANSISFFCIKKSSLKFFGGSICIFSVCGKKLSSATPTKKMKVKKKLRRPPSSISCWEAEKNVSKNISTPSKSIHLLKYFCNFRRHTKSRSLLSISRETQDFQLHFAPFSWNFSKVVEWVYDRE